MAANGVKGKTERASNIIGQLRIQIEWDFKKFSIFS